MIIFIDQALKPGGVLLIQSYGKNQLQYKTGGHGELHHLYDDEVLQSAFPNYRVLDIKTCTAEVDQGAGHKRMSAFFGFVAQQR